MDTLIRPFAPSDAADLRRVFHSSVHELAAASYSPAELDAWAPAEHDAAAWAARMEQLRPFVAERDGRIVGYADLQPDGYIDHFYVCGSQGRSGVGRALMRAVHQAAAGQGVAVLQADVSLAAEPFFLRHGFEVVERRERSIRGQTLRNCLMRKRIA